MSGWHLTWQDPVALLLAAGGLLLAWRLHRRLGPTGCASCSEGADHGAGSPSGEAVTAVPVSELSLGRRRSR